MASPADFGLLGNSSVWVLISYLLFLGLVFKFARHKVLSMIDGQIEEIRKELDMAENLRIEAQELLAQYKRKQRDAVQEATQIIENAKRNADKVRANAALELEQTMARKEEYLQERLDLMEAKLLNEMRTKASHLAVLATEEMIRQNLKKSDTSALIENSIDSVKAHLN